LTNTPPRNPRPDASTTPSTVTVPVARNTTMPPVAPSHAGAVTVRAAGTVRFPYSGTRTTCAPVAGTALSSGASRVNVDPAIPTTRANSHAPVTPARVMSDWSPEAAAGESPWLRCTSTRSPTAKPAALVSVTAEVPAAAAAVTAA
jgi:hypothetical protein